MNNNKRLKDEHIERLYYMKEANDDLLDTLKADLNENYDVRAIDELASEGIVRVMPEENRISLTKAGEKHATRLIRAHRLAERLLYDVLGGDYESGACEFEHTVTSELVDSICILLGHPRSCPHGMPIPEGQCCKKAARTVQNSVCPLSELKVGQSARVAYINCKSDQQLHRIDGLCIRPGAVISLHQRYPAFVVECEDNSIALDEEIAANICVWRDHEHSQAGR